jgi:hypothetical protein
LAPWRTVVQARLNSMRLPSLAEMSLPQQRHSGEESISARFRASLFFLAAMPEGSHPFPSRTRKLSPPGPMVLQGKLCGRVGRCQSFSGGSLSRGAAFSFSAPYVLQPLAFAARSAQPGASRWMVPPDPSRHLQAAAVHLRQGARSRRPAAACTRIRMTDAAGPVLEATIKKLYAACVSPVQRGYRISMRSPGSCGIGWSPRRRSLSGVLRASRPLTQFRVLAGLRVQLLNGFVTPSRNPTSFPTPNATLPPVHQAAEMQLLHLSGSVPTDG